MYASVSGTQELTRTLTEIINDLLKVLQIF